MAAAFCKQRTLVTNASLFYMCYCVDQMELTWIQSMVTETLAKKYEDGTMPGACLPQNINEDLLQPLPLAPKLNLLVLGGDGNDELQCLI